MLRKEMISGRYSPFSALATEEISTGILCAGVLTEAGFCGIIHLKKRTASGRRRKPVMTVPDYAKLLFALFLQLIGLILMTVTDPYPRRTQKRILLLISALALSLLWQNVLQYRLETESGDSFVRTAVSVYGYAVYPMIPLLFLKVLNPERRGTAFWNTGVTAVAAGMSDCSKGACKSR